MAVAIAIGSVFTLWSALYLIARYSAINTRRLVPWIRVLRHLTSWTTLALFLMSFCIVALPFELRLSVTLFLVGRDLDL